MSGHIGRIGGRQVVAVLALGGGLLLGPLLPAQAAETGPAGPGDGGPVPTTLDTVHDLASPVLVPPTGRPGGPTVGHWPGKR
ncbi:MULTISPECIES: hypothetical protein [unclassified Streptomyces]|uniref:hypothetical protein n=1 Tax=unclassified Streptomyces TaxID=2593676 RepID=UPI0013AB9F15|nr:MULTISPECIES: hypothetical protein [unclassified Streptomyces]MYS42644.1 hypothetical protein [Streptomyces sp. SID5998]MYX40988.1 hypothetical protein [Streptomyces sp. SID89]NED32712.1 hypothetical protein [Streptomyces sp. SID8499]NMO36800.1 hypothetical protein [Streptomyces sp. GMY02]